MKRVHSAGATHALHGIAATRRIEAEAQSLLAPGTLMDRAGAAAARLALALAPHARRVWIAAGPGNNGGDGIEAARLLQQCGRSVVVTLHGDAQRLPADAARALARARDAGVVFAPCGERLGRQDLAIDALLGIGATRTPEGALAESVRRLNAFEGSVLAIDVPSGLNADTGQPHGPTCVVADHTLALLTLKPGLFTAAGRDHAGTVWFDTLGTDASGVAAGGAADARLVGLDAPECLAALRRHAAHKGSFGDVAVIGGAPGMVGAALLAAQAAHAAGAGRVHVVLLTPAAGTLGHDPRRPELMFRPDWADSAPDMLAAATVVCGCGGGDAVARALPRVLAAAGRLVLDADALNAVAADGALAAALQTRAARSQPTVITPHPLEAARLLACTTASVQADRLHAAQTLADRFQVVVVLKGSGTVIAAPGRMPAIAATGNAALASAGTGDVLAGWLGGLWTQQRETDGLGDGVAVAVRAVVEHGAAAEPVAPGPLRAADLVEALHRRLRRCTGA